MTEAHPVVERYLAKLGEGLGGLAPDDRAETVREIRHHIDDAVGAGRPLDAVLEGLGAAEALARAYTIESLLHPTHDRRSSRLERLLKITALVVVGSVPTIVIVAVLGAVGISFVVSGVVVFVVGLLEAAHIHLPGVQMSDVPPVVAIVGGPIMSVLGAVALVGLAAYIRVLSRVIRAVLPKQTARERPR